MNREAAEALISSMGLVADVELVTSTETGGTVVEQSPAEGEKADPGSTVTIYVSNAPVPTTVQVPAVAGIGLTQAKATAKLATYQLKAKIVPYETADYPPGIVLQQSPVAGVVVQKGSYVEIWVSAVPTTTTTTEPPTTTTTGLPSTDTTFTTDF
jgi:beta-lactam-binding protein with PASTA domain